MKKFSIVIPVYNVEKYLKQCVDSILAQTIDDYEIVLVDDGSPDGSGKICDEYAEKYDNIFVYHKENGGLSDARNFGTLKATGEYIIYVDSDDYIGDIDLLRKTSDIIEKSSPTAVAYTFTEFIDGGEIQTVMKYSSEEINAKASFEEKLEFLIKNDQLVISAWGYAIKRQYIIDNNLFFKKGLLGEDTERAMRMFASPFEIVFLNEPSYFYRKARAGSITATIKEKNINDLYDTVSKYADLFSTEGAACQRILLNYVAYQYSILCALLVRASDKSFKKKIIEKLVSYKWLLEYDLSPKVKKVKKFTRIFGIRATIKILELYLKFRRKNKKKREKNA